MTGKRILKVISAALSACIICGCSSDGSSSKTTSVKLNPDKPVSITVWHYYNGAQQARFDSLIDEFNASVGKQMGIYVEGYSHGSVSDLEKAVTSSMNGEVGSGDFPDIFSSYADTAYSVQQNGMLADLTQYYSKDELSKYVD